MGTQWQTETDLKLDTLRADVDALKTGQDEIKTAMQQNTALTQQAVTFAENLGALNKLAEWATAAGKFALPLTLAWATFKGWWSK